MLLESHGKRNQHRISDDKLCSTALILTTGAEKQLGKVNVGGGDGCREQRP